MIPLGPQWYECCHLPVSGYPFCPEHGGEPESVKWFTLTPGGNMDNKRDELLNELKAEFPHGHPEFLPMLLEKMKLHSDKNHDYARGGNPLGNFERVAAILGQYKGLDLSDPVVVMLIYALKQVDATLWGLAQRIDQKVEGPIERLGDVLVYSGIAICALKDRAEARLLALKDASAKALRDAEQPARGAFTTEDLRAAAGTPSQPRHPFLGETRIPRAR